MEKYIIIFSLIVGLILLLILVISIVKNNSKKAKEEYNKLIKEGEKLKRELIFEAKEEIHNLKLEAEKEVQEKKKESKEIENYLDSKSYNIALDRLGKNIDSINFSKLIDKTFISYPNINFIIGGSLGIDKSILDKCNIVLSFSSLTFPHQLFRLMLLEQIYRSFKILNNERYHK